MRCYQGFSVAINFITRALLVCVPAFVIIVFFFFIFFFPMLSLSMFTFNLPLALSAVIIFNNWLWDLHMHTFSFTLFLSLSFTHSFALPLYLCFSFSSFLILLLFFPFFLFFSRPSGFLVLSILIQTNRSVTLFSFRFVDRKNRFSIARIILLLGDKWKRYCWRRTFCFSLQTIIHLSRNGGTLSVAHCICNISC